MLAMPASSLRSRPPRILRLAILVVTAALGPTLAPSQSVASTATGLSLEQPNRGDWPLVGRDYGNQHYSPLRQINASTIERLAPRALLQLQLEGASPGAEAAPVFVDGRMYTTTNYDVVTAFDMRHRTQLWRYVPKLGVAKPCCGPVNRGVAVANGMVYLGTLDSRVIALDQDSGTVRWQVVTNDPDSAYSITMAPTVVGDRVIVGSSGGEFATRGNVTAYDARTGAQLWRWYAIPSPEEGGWWGKWTPKAPTGESLDRDIAQERADSARYADSWKGGGGPVWAQPAYDAESGLLFVTVGNPAPSNDGRGRPGDNLFTVSVVALDVATGKMRWYFQAVRHDVWDYGLATPPVIVRDGGRKLVAVPSKMGWVYILDAASGALVRRSDAFIPQQNLFVVPTAEGIVSAPGPIGGANWPPSAYSPRTSLLYVVSSHATFTLTRADAEARKGEYYIGGEQKLDAHDPPYGMVAAIRLPTGKVAWQQKTGLLMSGALATAGDLVFVGQTDGWFRAYDARTGKVVWEFFCGAGVNAPAISFELDGEQYIAVVAAGSRYSELHGSALLVFGLGGGSMKPRGEPLVAQRSAPATHATVTQAGGAWIPQRATRVGPYLAYVDSASTAYIELNADLPMGFDGAMNGGRSFTIPLGWTVNARFRNRDAAPHSVRVIDATPTFALDLPEASFAGGETSSSQTGSRAGSAEVFIFRADKAGDFLLACAVPGHASGGMFLRLIVRADAPTPVVR